MYFGHKPLCCSILLCSLFFSFSVLKVSVLRSIKNPPINSKFYGDLYSNLYPRTVPSTCGRRDWPCNPTRMHPDWCRHVLWVVNCWVLRNCQPRSPHKIFRLNPLHRTDSVVMLPDGGQSFGCPLVPLIAGGRRLWLRSTGHRVHSLRGTPPHGVNGPEKVSHWQ